MGGKGTFLSHTTTKQITNKHWKKTGCSFSACSYFIHDRGWTNALSQVIDLLAMICSTKHDRIWRTASCAHCSAWPNFILRYIVDLQNDELWEGSYFNALWEGLEPNFAPFSFPQCIIFDFWDQQYTLLQRTISKMTTSLEIHIPSVEN